MDAIFTLLFLAGLVYGAVKLWPKLAGSDFKRTKTPLDAERWDHKSCFECGSADLFIVDRSSDSWKSTDSVTRTATIRNSEGDETGSIDWDQEVQVTRHSRKTIYRCGFCLYEFSHTRTETE